MEEPVARAAVGMFMLLQEKRGWSRPNNMPKSFRIHDRVSWNSEASRVSGMVIRIHTRDFNVNGYTHHATPDEPQYEIKSSKTDHIAFHKACALNRLGD
jgi:hypothetical protein